MFSQVVFQFFKRERGADINCPGISAGRKLLIHFFFSFPFKTTERERGVGGSKKPGVARADTVPDPDGCKRNIFYHIMPGFPMSDLIQNILELHKAQK
jgi:hypothetical protein